MYVLGLGGEIGREGLTGSRFVQEDITNVQRRLAKEEATLKGDIKDLEKKFTYLETTYVNAQGGLNAILKGSR
jgi:prefoldin subunit 1